LSLCMLCRSWGFSVGRRRSRFGGSFFGVGETVFRKSSLVVEAHEQRSRGQLAAGLTALSRCAIPQKVVTTERVAKSHNIIRSSPRAVPICDIACAGSGTPVYCFASLHRNLSGEARRATAPSEPPPRLIKRRRDGGCRPWPDRDSPCSRCSAAQCRTMPGRPGSNPHARQWY
jgi:hypothetical protein